MPAPDNEPRIVALEHAVFGLAGEGGLLDAMRTLNGKLDRLYLSIAGAAVSFGLGSIAVVVTLIATNLHHS